eukprot:1394400-Amorphochlora_amoeboformis.AAC.2
MTDTTSYSYLTRPRFNSATRLPDMSDAKDHTSADELPGILLATPISCGARTTQFPNIRRTCRTFIHQGQLAAPRGSTISAMSDETSCAISDSKSDISVSSVPSDSLVTQEGVDFLTLYHDPIGKRYLSSFMKQMYARENIEFDNYVERYKTVIGSGDRKKAQSIARFIRLRFLSEESSPGSGQWLSPEATDTKTLGNEACTPVNIDGPTREALVSTIDNEPASALTAGLFNKAQRQIIRLIRTDCFPKFRRSKEFQRYVKAREAREVHNLSDSDDTSFASLGLGYSEEA